MGDNIGAPYAESVADRLEQDYGELLDNAKNTIADANDLPHVVESSIDVSAVAAVVVKLRDLAARGKSHRAAEKEPYLRAGEAVFTFFTKRLVEPLDNCRATLQSRLNDYKQRQLAEERAKREAEAAVARKQQEEARRAREAAEAAERRARSDTAKEQRAAEAAAARVEDDMSSAEAEKAILSTMAKAGKMVGERFEGDRAGLVTMRKVPVVIIEDASKLNLEALRPYIKEEHLLSALRQWARATNYEQEMPGAVVGMREATVVR
jgi:flagellar biosynthesis GTPase FlhF